MKSTFIPCSLACFVGANFLLSSAYAETAEAPKADEASAQTLPEVKVEASSAPEDYQKKSLSSPKTPEKRVDTPQSTTVVPAQLMKDQGVLTLRDALRDVSGLSLSAGEGGVQGDNLSLRGFSARSDIYMDGMRDFGSYTRDPFNMEAVEVLKGPSSALFGRGSTGGVINQVSKSPKEKAFGEAIVTFGSDNTRRGTADFNKPVAPNAAFRLNIMDHFNNVSDRDVVENRRFGIAPSFTYGLGESTRYTLSYLHQSQNDIPDYGLPYVNSRPANVDRKNFYGVEDHNFLKTHAEVVTFRIEHDISKDLKIRNQVRNANYERRFQITEARVPATVGFDTPLNTIQIQRNQIAGESNESSTLNDLSFSARFETGFVKHSFVVGVEVGREMSKPRRFAWTGVADTSLEDPISEQPFSGSSTVSSRVNTTAQSTAIYVADALRFGESWILNLGARNDTIKGKYEQEVGTPVKLSRTDKESSYRAGLVFKPTQNSSVYANYGTSFNPSIENLSLAANTANLDPEKSKTMEVGVKAEFFDEALTFETAVFRLDKFNARTPDKNNATLNVLDGQQRVDGAEISLVGYVTPRLQISSGYTNLLGKVTETNRVEEKNQILANTPKHSGNLWASYAVAEKWDLGAGAMYVSSRTGSTVPDAATGKIKKVYEYTTLSAMAKYRVSTDVETQLNVLNLTDKEYFDSLHPNHLVPGAGRTFLLTTAFRMQ